MRKWFITIMDERTMDVHVVCISSSSLSQLLGIFKSMDVLKVIKVKECT